jgi:hypothetical protein
MHLVVNSPYTLVHELRLGPTLTDALLYSETVTQDLSELVEEAYAWGLLSGRLPPDAEELQVDVELTWVERPIVDKVQLHVTAGKNAHQTSFMKQFAMGRWVRTAQEAALRLREEGRLADGQVARRILIGLERDRPPALNMPPLEPPPIAEQSLEEFGVRRLGSGSLLRDRPVLVNKRMHDDCVRRCEEAGMNETGGSVIGKMLRLAEPLPGTATPIVTVLSTIVEDARHAGAPLEFTFSPEGLYEAMRIADLRSKDETVVTVEHSHGWNSACGNCNQSVNCPLAAGRPSLQDYRLLESLLPGKVALLPITGRKVGAQGRRPVLQIYSWQGGELRAIEYQEYFD